VLLLSQSGVESVISMLDSFGLDKEEFDLIVEWGEKFIKDEEKQFSARIPAAIKAKLTRTYVWKSGNSQPEADTTCILTPVLLALLLLSSLLLLQLEIRESHSQGFPWLEARLRRRVERTCQGECIQRSFGRG
jgi:hypothetical protein